MTCLGTLSSKGQITIPAEVRKRLGLSEGDKIEFVMEDTITIIRPAKRRDNPFARYRGAMASRQSGSIAEIVTEERARRGRETED